MFNKIENFREIFERTNLKGNQFDDAYVLNETKGKGVIREILQGNESPAQAYHRYFLELEARAEVRV